MTPQSGRRSFFWLCSFLVVCATVSAGAAGEYRTIEVESLKITFDSEWGARTTPGYLPVRFDITNLGEARVIEILAHGSRFFRPSGRTGVSSSGVRRAVRLARGDRVRLTIPVPIFADNENVRFEIQEDGETIEGFTYTGFQSGVVPGDAAALIVGDPGSPLGTLATGWPRPVPPSSGTVVAMSRAAGSGASVPRLDFFLDPTRLPTNWLGFTSLRAVMIGPHEWQQLNDEQKGALITWTAAGGDLIFVDGDINALFPSGQAPLAPPPDQPVRAHFFGRIHLLASESVAARGLGDVLLAAEKLQDENWALPANRARDWGTITARGFRLLIPGIDGVPARAYLMILLVFTFLIGPVNYWILWRRRQQVLLVLTTPFISAVFILLLAGYVVAGEGLGVRGRAVSFTMLDQVRKQAATRASVSLYAAGMTPAGGLYFPRDVAVFPIGRDGSGSRETLFLDLSEAQRFSSGVIQARSPANFEQIAVRPARERLSFSRDATGIGVVNGLGATVTVLLYRADQTLYTLAGPLAPGGRATLTAGGRAPVNLVPSDIPQATRLLHLLENQPEGTYLAVLERSPFWDPGVSAITERGSFHLVIGWPEGQP